MSSPAPADVPATATSPTEEPPPVDGWSVGLAQLRAELDRIDDALHDQLMRRATVVERVARAGKRGAYRPGREAAIIRRLLARHSGALPPQTIVRIWRELLAGTTAMQGAFNVTVCQTAAASGYIQLAREHFGALTPVHAYGSPAQAMAEVSRGAASVAVLPLPSQTDTVRDAWWTAMLQNEQPRTYIVACLPFWAPRPEGLPATQALVLATTEPDPSGRDRSLLGLELDTGISRAGLATALTKAGLAPGSIILRRDDVAQALVEIDGFVADDDPRLARLDASLRRPLVLGVYAVPIDGGAA